jgi:hypothetical protein
MILCRIDVEENSKCKRCCKDCYIFLEQQRCEFEGKCIIAKRHMECDHLIIEKGDSI